MFFNLLNILFLDSIFPVIFVLGLFAFLNYKQIPLNSIFRFIMIFFIVTFLIRTAAYISLDGKINARYFYTLTLFFIIFSVIGFPKLVELLQKYISKKILTSTNNHVKIFLILVIGIFCIGKALSSPESKSYIKEITQIIRNSDRKAVLIFDNTKNSVRIAYHLGIEYFAFESIVDKDFKNWYYALGTITSKNIKVFVLVEKSDKDFREFFIEKKINFLLKLIKEYKEKHICFSLYEYDCCSNSTN